MGDAFVVDDGGRPRLRVDGAEADRFLHGFCTADVKAMAEGESREAFFTTIKGRVLSYGVLTRDAAGVEAALFDASAEPLREHLAKYAAIEPVDVRIIDGRGRRLAVGVLSEGDRWPFAAATVIACDGIDPTAGPEAWEAFRVRCGIPRVGADLTDRNLVQEAGRTTQAVSFEKGCYLGQEPIARLDAMGHTNKELRVLDFRSGTSVAVGEPVLCDGREAGAVTSAATAGGRTWAIATLKTFANTAGTSVLAGGHEAAVRLPV